MLEQAVPKVTLPDGGFATRRATRLESKRGTTIQLDIEEPEALNIHWPLFVEDPEFKPRLHKSCLTELTALIYYAC